jgi:hypothetical protein
MGPNPRPYAAADATGTNAMTAAAVTATIALLIPLMALSWGLIRLNISRAASIGALFLKRNRTVSLLCDAKGRGSRRY